MIVCSCNALRDSELAAFCASGVIESCEQLYACVGCSVRCGRCADYVEGVLLKPAAASETV